MERIVVYIHIYVFRAQFNYCFSIELTFCAALGDDTDERKLRVDVAAGVALTRSCIMQSTTDSAFTT